MNFQETVESLKLGKFMTRDAWNDTKEYVACLPGIPVFWKITPVAPNAIPGMNGNAMPWLTKLEDINATDWQELGELQFLVPVTV